MGDSTIIIIIIIIIIINSVAWIRQRTIHIHEVNF
jgi:hypothetical protein